MRHPQEWTPPWGVFTEPRSRGRWWLLVAGSLLICVVSWVLTHDTTPGLGLSLRSWLTLGLAALVLILLNSYRAAGGRLLVRAAAEYAVVAALAVLLATSTTGASQQAPAAPHHPNAQAPAQARVGDAGDACPSVLHTRAWLTCLWHQASQAANTDHLTGRAR